MGRHKKVALEELTREQKFEIVRSYREAKDQRAQIGILADLNDCTPLTIRKVLREAGIDDHENDEKQRFTLHEEGEDTEIAENAETQEGFVTPDGIAVSTGPFYRAEAILALTDPADSDAIKERAVELILELVRKTAYAALFGR